MRSLFLNELCNFSANSWAEDQRDANELGFCAGSVIHIAVIPESDIVDGLREGDHPQGR